MHDVHRQTDALQCAQGIGTDHVTAVNDRLRALRRRGFHRRCKQSAVIVAVGNDADFHGRE